jgi:hypothetical protein
VVFTLLQYVRTVCTSTTVVQYIIHAYVVTLAARSASKQKDAFKLQLTYKKKDQIYTCVPAGARFTVQAVQSTVRHFAFNLLIFSRIC